jgi:two-component system NarL family sensor kinase
MQPRTSIYHKLIFYIFFLGIFVIVTVSLYSFITARNAILQRTFDQLTSLKVAKKEQVEQFFNDRLKEVELFSHQENSGLLRIKTPKLEGYISFNVSDEGPGENYERFFRSGGYFSKMFIVTGNKLKSYNLESISEKSSKYIPLEKLNLEPLISRAKKENKAFIADYTFNYSDTTTSLFIASPIFGRNHTISGYAIFEFNPTAINEIMKNEEVVKSLGRSGEVYLVGPDSLMRSESRFFKNSILHLPVKTESIRKAFRSGEGTHLNKDYRGIMTLSSFNRLKIPGLDWIIVAEMDKREAMRPVYKLANEIVFLSIFITLILFVVAYIISRTITGPIIELKNATIRVRNGDLESVLHIKSNDELGELTENFNLMTSQLKTQQEELKNREVRIFSSFIDGQEDERQRLARELHDGLGQMIIATKLKTESLVNSVDGINNDNIARLRHMYDSLVDEVRSISNNLMPAALQEFGLEIALKQICSEISAHSQIKVIFDSQISNREMDKRIVVYVFRIAQEALNNAVKHAGASEIIMNLIGNEKMISLNVQDDGIGINLEQPLSLKGRGINSMNERVRLLNGLIDISKGVNKGTIVSVKIPLM